MECVPSIDKITIFIPHGTTKALEDYFDSLPLNKEPHKIRQYRTRSAYLHEGSRIDFIRGNLGDSRAWIRLYDNPSMDIQVQIANVLINRLWFPSRTELAVDVYPHPDSTIESAMDYLCDELELTHPAQYAWNEGTDPRLVAIQDVVMKHVDLRHGKKTSINSKAATGYIGKEGNVRKGGTGIRVYPGPSPRKAEGIEPEDRSFLRVELLINERVAQRLATEEFLVGFPIMAHSIDFSRFISVYSLHHDRIHSRMTKTMFKAAENARYPSLANRLVYRHYRDSYLHRGFRNAWNVVKKTFNTTNFQYYRDKR